MAKEHEYRFSITLNRNDPLHRTAINALNAQGRRKSQFIVNAITNYIMEGKGRENLTMPNRAYIEKICLEVYQSILQQNQKLGDVPFPAVGNEENDPCVNGENMEFVTVVLNSFRKQS